MTTRATGVDARCWKTGRKSQGKLVDGHAFYSRPTTYTVPSLPYFELEEDGFILATFQGRKKHYKI